MSARGEKVIKDGPNEITILYTNRVLMAAEKRLGKTIVGIINGGYSTMGLNELVILLQSGLMAAKKDSGESGRVSLDDAMDILDRVGFPTIYGAVVLAVTDVISYSQNGAGPDEETDGPN